MSGSPGSELLSTKLAAPAPRPGLIPQTDLQARLQTALEAKLCLLDAPAGSGKTTLLAQWCATAGAGRVAWVSLDEGDNDPTRFWVYVAEALRTVEPNLGAGVLDALRRPSADLHRTVLPSLLNELGEAGSPLFLVLDDYHLITNPACHQSVGYFLDHLPAGVHVALAGRTAPRLLLPMIVTRPPSYGLPFWPRNGPALSSTPSRRSTAPLSEQKKTTVRSSSCNSFRRAMRRPTSRSMRVTMAAWTL